MIQVRLLVMIEDPGTIGSFVLRNNAEIQPHRLTCGYSVAAICKKGAAWGAGVTPPIRTTAPQSSRKSLFQGIPLGNPA